MAEDVSLSIRPAFLKNLFQQSKMLWYHLPSEEEAPMHQIIWEQSGFWWEAPIYQHQEIRGGAFRKSKSLENMWEREFNSQNLFGIIEWGKDINRRMFRVFLASQFWYFFHFFYLEFRVATGGKNERLSKHFLFSGRTKKSFVSDRT